MQCPGARMRTAHSLQARRGSGTRVRAATSIRSNAWACACALTQGPLAHPSSCPGRVGLQVRGSAQFCADAKRSTHAWWAQRRWSAKEGPKNPLPKEIPRPSSGQRGGKQEPPP